MSAAVAPSRLLAQDHAPVVIAGGGPVGLALALALARAGVRTLVLERKRALDPHSRATLMVPRSLAFLERLGVLPAFLAEGERNDAIRILQAPDRRPLLAFDFAALAAETPTPFALALAQDRTERLLLDAVRATGLVEVAFDTPLLRFQDHGDAGGVRVWAGADAAPRVVTADVLVGADGAHSAVREQLGWPLEGKTYPTRAFLADVEVDAARDFTGGWLADPEAPSFTIAVRFGRTAAGDGDAEQAPGQAHGQVPGRGVWRLIESAIADDVTEADFEPRARRLTAALFGPGAWRATRWTAAYRKHERRAPRFHRGRVVLAGDAAHLNSPAGGQGLNAGLADADLLARTLAGVLTAPGRPHRDQAIVDRPTHGPALAAGLAAYEAARVRAFDEDVRALTDGIERMETAPAWLRRAAFSALGLARRAGLERRLERLVARKLAMLPAAARA